MTNIMKKFFILAAASGMAFILAPQANAQQATPTPEQMDSTLESLKNMPADQRQQILNAATENLRNMPPEQRQQLIEEAKARAQNLTDAQKSAYEQQWQNSLTPEQKQMMIEQLKQQGIAADTPVPPKPMAPAAQNNNAENIMQQIQGLPPEQRQKLLDSLQNSKAQIQ